MLYQPGSFDRDDIRSLISMAANADITIAQAAAQTGVPATTLRYWCRDFPGLGRRIGRGGWLIADFDLLLEMASLRDPNTGRMLPVRARSTPTSPPQAEEPPQPPHAELTTAEAAVFFDVDEATVLRWCTAVPGLGHQLKVRGTWLIDLAAAVVVATVRKQPRTKPLTIAVMARQAERSLHDPDPKTRASCTPSATAQPAAS